MDDESKHSGPTRVIIDSPMNNEMQQLSPKNGGGKANSAEIDNENYYNEEDEEEETMMAPQQNVDK